MTVHRFAAVLLLAGGRSRRLGTAKAWLEWDGAPLLIHTLRRLAPLSAGNVIVASRQGVDLPAGDYTRVDDRVADAGPLAGLEAGLGAVEGDGRVAVVACDYPFATSELLIDLARVSADVVLPRAEGHLHPLLAVWRPCLAAACREALERGEHRVRSVLDRATIGVLDRPACPVFLNVNDDASLARARTELARNRS